MVDARLTLTAQYHSQTLQETEDPNIFLNKCDVLWWSPRIISRQKSAARMDDSTMVEDVNVTWNTTLEQFLLDHLGPRSKDLVSAIILTFVYSLIFLSGLIGNICTCVVIARNNCMQTTTNYYLFSLAVSDLLLLFFGK
ncbi:hypothetical protein C0Q70_11891 [Pomacea canaliculata]|uniref:G-protein coupled receptors family 1 profile domain-containing protein n=1 Tax=Pomacea canaliculata TaxID=400727 RepID=A0A2T7P784_POMCA|nr:hypothetical protein C0Q70_11891 [Pomacea canaliculata]